MASMSELELQTFAVYAEKHEIYDLFHDALTRLIVAKPSDPYQFLMETISRSQDNRAIIVFSPPVSGVDLIISQVVKQLDLVHIHAGRLLEIAAQKQTSAGFQAKGFLERGDLVPDYVITHIILARLRESDVLEKGYLLDGFPRNKQQVQALLEEGFIPDHVLDLNVPDGVLVNRATGLRYDPISMQTHNMNEDKKVFSGESRLIVKQCDTAPAVLNRIRIYRRNHKIIMSYFNVQNSRTFNSPKETSIKEILDFLGVKALTKSPRSFRIVIGGLLHLIVGLPGSGKSTVSRQISDLFGAIVVSTRGVMLQAVSAGVGEHFLPFLEKPYLAPQDLVADAVIARLKKNDCVQKGWILDGFPSRTKDATLLKENGFFPNRFFWLNTSAEICNSRLINRRHDPMSARVINLLHIPADLVKVDLTKWIQASCDTSECLSTRFKESESMEKDLKRIFVTKSVKNPTGILEVIESDGVGEEENHPRRVFEVVQSNLTRPISTHIQ